MTNFQQLFGKYRSRQIDLSELMKQSKFCGNIEDELVAELRKELSDQHYKFSVRDVDALVELCVHYPSVNLSKLLCRIIENIKLFPGLNIESVATALELCNSPESVPSLRQAADYDAATEDSYPFDDSRNFNKKCVFALQAIGSQNALEAIKDISRNSPFTEVKEVAQQILNRTG